MVGYDDANNTIYTNDPWNRPPGELAEGERKEKRIDEEAGRERGEKGKWQWA